MARDNIVSRYFPGSAAGPSARESQYVVVNMRFRSAERTLRQIRIKGWKYIDGNRYTSFIPSPALTDGNGLQFECDGLDWTFTRQIFSDDSESNG